jgi:hypothetical protein
MVIVLRGTSTVSSKSDMLYFQVEIKKSGSAAAMTATGKAVINGCLPKLPSMHGLHPALQGI